MAYPNDFALATALESAKKTIFSQSDALAHMNNQYQTDAFSQRHLQRAIEIMHDTLQYRSGKIVVCGIGKSFKIANKLVATLNSLSLYAAALHPSEALHGDLGAINEQRDCLVFITASGNTPELINLLPHISDEVPIILLTCNRISKLSQSPRVKALMYAELPPALNENAIHGLPAPTVSATLSLVLADAAVLSLSEMIERDLSARRRQFSIKHPGGSIGADLAHLNSNVASSASHDVSCSSLLSLNRIRTSIETGSSSSDEEIEIKAPAQKSLTVTNHDLMKLFSERDELKLLSWITLNDSITIDSRSISSEKIKDLYKTHFGNTKNWHSFSESLISELA